MVKLERMAATPEGLAKFNAQPDLSEAHALSCFVNVLEAMTEGMLGGLEQLTHASMVLASPQADTLLVAPVPGVPPTPDGQPAPTAQAFVKKLQVPFAPKHNAECDNAISLPLHFGIAVCTRLT